MPQAGADDRREALGDPPGDVHVTVLLGPCGPTLRQQLVLRARVVACVAVVTVAAAALGAVVLTDGASRSARTDPRGQSHATGAAEVVAASRIPPGCVSIGIALHDPRFGRQSFDRTIPCLRRLEALGGQTTQWPRAWRAVPGRQWMAP